MYHILYMLSNRLGGKAPNTLCGSRKFSVIQSVERRGILSKELLHFLVSRTPDRPFKRFHPTRIFRRLIGHGPIAAIHNAVEAEALDDVIDIGLELLSRPTVVIGLGDQAGDLAPDVGELGQGLDLSAPWIQQAGLDIRLPDMIEDELHIRALGHHFDGVGHLWVMDANVEVQSIFWQQLYAGDKVRAQAELDIGLELNDAADALDARIGGQLLQRWTDRSAELKRRPGHNALQPAVLLSQALDPIGFFLELRKIHFGLQEDHFLYSDGSAGAVIIFQQVGLVEQGDTIQPGIAQTLRIPNVEVRINYWKIQHLFFLCMFVIGTRLWPMNLKSIIK